MNRLDAMLQHGETVLWRHDERSMAGPLWPYLVAAGVPLSVIAVIATVILWHVEVPAGIMVLVGLLLLYPVFSVFLAWGSEWLPRAVAITDRRILRAGSRVASREDLARAEIVRAELFEGAVFGAIDLQFTDGGIRTLHGIDNAEGFVRALDVPARIWRPQPRPTAPFRAILIRFAIYAALIAGFHFLRTAMESAVGGPIAGAFETTLFMLGVFILCAAAFHGIYVASHRLAMRLLPTEEAHQYRCWYLDRRCRGLRGHPETGGPVWARLDKWYTGLIARQAFGGNQDCDCTPEVIGPSE